MIGLPRSEEVVTICRAVSIQYQKVTERQNSYVNTAPRDVTHDKNKTAINKTFKANADSASVPLHTALYKCDYYFITSTNEADVV